MGKINEIQEEVKQSFGSNSFTTTIKEDTVEFDSAKDNFTFKDPVNIEGDLAVSGTFASAYMNADEMQIDSISVSDIILQGENIAKNGVGREDYGTIIIAENLQTSQTGAPNGYDVNEPLISGETYNYTYGGEVLSFTVDEEYEGNRFFYMGPEGEAASCVYNVDGNAMGTGKALAIAGPPNMIFGNIYKEGEIIKKIDSKFIPSSDWNANEGEPGYIENRPFYKLPDEEQVFISGELNANAQIVGSDSSGNFYFNPPFPFISGETATFVVEGVETVSWQVQGAPDNSQGGGSGVMTQGGISFSWDIAGIGPDLSKTAFINVSGNPELYGNKNFTFKRIVNGEIKKLDEKFISTPDWNAIEGQPGFIKNRPFGLGEGYGYILDKTTSDFVSRFDWDFGNKLIEGEQYRVYRNGSLIKTAYAEKRSDDEIAVTIETGQLVSYSPTNAFFGNNGQIAGTAGHYQVYGKGIVMSTISNSFIPQLGGVQFKIDGTSLKVSLDSGSSWKTVSIS